MNEKELAEDICETLNNKYCNIPWSNRPDWFKDDAIKNIHTMLDKVIRYFYIEQKIMFEVKS
jgi:hypothetical protein